MSKDKPPPLETFDDWLAQSRQYDRMHTPAATARALLALLDMEESVKETNLGKVLGHLQAQIAELQADIDGMKDGPWDPPPIPR